MMTLQELRALIPENPTDSSPRTSIDTRARRVSLGSSGLRPLPSSYIYSDLSPQSGTTSGGSAKHHRLSLPNPSKLRHEINSSSSEELSMPHTDKSRPLSQSALSSMPRSNTMNSTELRNYERRNTLQDLQPPRIFAPQSSRPPSDAGTLTPVGDDSDARSMKKIRHISLQSRVDSIANESMYSRSSLPDVPPMYRNQGRSTSYILDPMFPRSHDPDMIEYSPLRKSAASASSDKAQQLIKIPVVREILFILTVAVSHLMTQAALGQALAPIDIIAESFGKISPGEKSWFIAAYSLTVGTFILISGRVGDIMGHKRVFAFGYGWLGVWSCFAGFSIYPGRQIFFDVCRAMQGIGPALLMPNGLALFARAYPPGIKKNLVFSLFGAMAPAGFVIGAACGSMFSQLVWWPWAFWSFGLASFGLSFFAMLVVPRELSVLPPNPPGFDFTGSIVGVAGLVLINVAWNNGPLYGWGVPHVYFVLIIGFLCFIAFLWVERRARYPILPMHAMNSTVCFVLSLVGVGWGSFGVWVFYVWRFLETVRNISPLTASAQFAPAVVCGLLAAGMTGFLLTHTPVSFVMMVSMMAFLAGITIAATMPVEQSYWKQMFISIVIMPFGMDMSFPAATIILSNHMPKEHQGLAGSLVNTVVNYSISIALGIAGTVEVTTSHKAESGAEYLWGLRCAMYSGIGLAGAGVLLGIIYFLTSLIREGWKIMDH